MVEWTCGDAVCVSESALGKGVEGVTAEVACRSEGVVVKVYDVVLVLSDVFTVVSGCVSTESGEVICGTEDVAVVTDYDFVMSEVIEE